MENKQNPAKTNRILYLIVVGVLVIAALVVGLTAAFGRKNKTPEPSQSTDDQPSGGQSDVKPSEEPTDQKPIEYLAPTSGVISQKHDSASFIYSVTMNDWRVHEGIDIATTAGAEVKATAAGKIKDISVDPWMGQCITIDHGNGVVSIYRNLAETMPDGIAVGASVAAGQVIGAVGETARVEVAEEAHLHFEMEADGKQVDPLSYISKESYEASLRMDQAFES